MSIRLPARERSPEAREALPEIRGPRCQPKDKDFCVLADEAAEAAELCEGIRRC